MKIESVLPKDNIAAFAHAFFRTPDGKPLQLHQTQIEALERPEPDVTICAGRRWGKSLSEAVKASFTAMKYPGTHRFIVSPTQDQSHIIFSEIVRQIQSGELAEHVKHIVYSPFPQIEWKNGSFINARSAGNDGKYLRGHHADFITVDECGFVPYKVVEEVLMQMMQTSKYGWITRISTPNGRNHFFDSFMRGWEGGDPDCWSGKFPTWTSPHINQKSLLRERKIRTKLSWDVEYGAQFNENQNVLFRWEYVQKVVTDRLDIPMDPIIGHRYVIGWDPARLQDRSAVVVIDASVAPFEVVAIQDISGQAYSIQEKMVETYAKRYNNAVVCQDATSPGSDRTLESLVAMGIEAYPFVFTNTTKWELMQGLALAIEHREILIPYSADLLTELRLYEVIKNPNSNIYKLGAPEGPSNHDDFVTALALAVAQARVRPRQIDLSFIQMG